MHETWSGEKLSEADKQLLQKAVNADRRDLQEESESTVDTAEIALGSLGKGVIVRLSRLSFCGTGGCPIYAYVREKTGYRKVLSFFGWAFAVVDSHGAVPTWSSPAMLVALELHFIYSTTMENLSVSELAKCSHRNRGTRRAVGGTRPK